MSHVTTSPTRRTASWSRSTGSTGSAAWAWSAGRPAGPSPTSSHRSRWRPWSRTSCPYVGRTGSLTPVAHLTPVKVAGSTVSRATLHNLDEVRRKDIRIGDHVVLHKAGDVIPEVVRPIVERRTGTEREFQMPAACPVCGTAIVQDEGAVRHYCPNPACPARVGQEFGHFAGRGGMDIEGAGWMVLSQLLERGMIHSRGDFYRLTVEQLETLDRFARKSAENLKAAIDRSRVRPLARILYALGIPQVGEQTAIDLATWIAGTWPPAEDEPMGGPDGWFARVTRELEGLPRSASRRSWASGPTSPRPWPRGSRRPRPPGVLQDLVDAGVEPVRPAPVVRGPQAELGPLAGKTLVVTGTLAGFDRQGAEDAIRAAGRQGVRLHQPQDELSRGGRERRFQAGQGAGAGRPGGRRGWLPAICWRGAA